MINKLYCWHDKVDKLFMPDSFMLSRSERAVCRGFLKTFETDKKLNPKEYELVCLGQFDDETGSLVPSQPVVVNVNQIFDDSVPSDGTVVDE